MPMIDVYAPAGTFPTGVQRQLAEELARALLRAEGAPLQSPYLENTGVYLHLLEPATVHTAASPTPETVRVQVLTPPGVLDAAGRAQLIASMTDLIGEHAATSNQQARTWVLLTEGVEGGWGIAGLDYRSAHRPGAQPVT